MERLEISEIYFKTIDLKKLRLDSDFYKKTFLRANRLLTSRKHVLFSEAIEVLTDYHANGSYETLKEHVELFDVKDFAHMIRTTDFIRDDFESEVKYISESAYNHLQKTKVFGGEILINKIGTNTGQSFLMPKVDKPTSLGMNIFMLRLKEGFSSLVYNSYLNSNIGKLVVEQKISGASPKSIDKESVRSIFIPLFSEGFQKNIDEIILKSQKLKLLTKNAYLEAENILLKEICLLDFQPTKEPVNIKNFKESFGVSGRLDAEYYQKKYEEVIENVKSQKYGTLKDIVSIGKSIEPGSNYYSDDETGLPFMRVADFNKFGLSEPNKRLTLDFVKDNKDKIDELKPKKGTILFSKDGSVGVAYYLREDFEGVNSGAILHLKVKDESEVIPEYLTLALNSKVVQMQAERDAGGSIILHWRVGEIQNVVVPIIDYDKQKLIAKLVEQSFKLKKESEQLLEIAKRSVEIAIEQNEETALQYIEQSMAL